MQNFENHCMLAGKNVNCEIDKNLDFALHFHDGYEFLYCYDGVVNVTVVDRIYRVRQSKCVLIAPNQPHSYETPDYSKTFICVFPEKLIEDFYLEYKGKEAMYPVFSLPAAETHCKKLQNADDVYIIKSLLYGIAAAFRAHTAFTPVDERKYATLQAIIGYVENNVDDDVDMREMAQTLGYSYNYVSALFNTAFGANFMDVVNKYRINKAEDLLLDTDMPIAEIAKKVGYGSLRSFNRNFKKYSGKTPSEAKDFKENGVVLKF